MICVHCHQPDATESRSHSCQQDPRLEARYCLREVIGTGAKGTLWRALDLQWGHEVAIKERGKIWVTVDSNGATDGAQVYVVTATGVITSSVWNSASPTSTWLEGV